KGDRRSDRLISPPADADDTRLRIKEALSCSLGGSGDRMDRPHLKRRLTAVMIADVVGYSRLMSVDEESTHLRLSDYIKNSIEPKISEHGGRLIRSAGEGSWSSSTAQSTRCIVLSRSSMNWPSTTPGPLPIAA